MKTVNGILRAILSLIPVLILGLNQQSHVNSILKTCAQFEKGGVYGKLAAKFGFRWDYLRLPRYQCYKYDQNQKYRYYPTYNRANRHKCNYKWSSPRDYKTIEYILTGAQYSKDYRYQLHFCNPIYRVGMQYCPTPYLPTSQHHTRAHRHIAFELIKYGTYLAPTHVNCICIRTSHASRYAYKYPVDPTRKTKKLKLLINKISLTCGPQGFCSSINASCYREWASKKDKKIQSGNVLCKCPNGYFCPIYLADKFRRNATLPGEILSRYEIQCMKRRY